MKLPKSLTTVTPFSKFIALILFIIFPIITFYLGLRYQNPSEYPSLIPKIIPTQPLGNACTDEAKLCPDGTGVGRTGPNCEFAACPPVNVIPSQTTQTGSCCSKGQEAQGYQCIRNCGGPVAGADEPDPGYSCLSPDQIQSHNRFGCPKCLSSMTFISTPYGEVLVTDIKLGDTIWTIDKSGQKVSAQVVQTSSVPVSSSHQMIHLVLTDGREVWVSPLHPTKDGIDIYQLKAGERYDNSIVKTAELVPYGDRKTYDILPAGDTGFYYANGILLGSTLKK